MELLLLALGEGGRPACVREKRLGGYHELRLGLVLGLAHRGRHHHGGGALLVGAHEGTTDDRLWVLGEHRLLVLEDGREEGLERLGNVGSLLRRLLLGCWGDGFVCIAKDGVVLVVWLIFLVISVAVMQSFTIEGLASVEMSIVWVVMGVV